VDDGMASTRDLPHGRAAARPALVAWSTPFAVAATGLGTTVAVAALVRLLPFGAPTAVAVLGAYGVLSAVVLARFGDDAEPGTRSFGLANAVTLARGALNALLLGLLVDPAALDAVGGDAAGWLVVAVALSSLALDGVDGWVARRCRLASAFGARFDVQVDALLLIVLALAAVVTGQAGLWVFALAAGYYGFLAARTVWPWLARPLPPSRARKGVFVAQATTLVVICAPPVTTAVAAGLTAATLALMAVSFGRDVRWLWRRAAASTGARAR
jgi:phosphatidylglycerophosphate synthase